MYFNRLVETESTMLTKNTVFLTGQWKLRAPRKVNIWFYFIYH